MTSKTRTLSEDRRSEIVAEGLQAAIDGLTPFACPYFADAFPERFRAWCEGFWSFDRTKH